MLEELGLLKKNRLDVQLIYTASSPTRVQALLKDLPSLNLIFIFLSSFSKIAAPLQSTGRPPGVAAICKASRTCRGVPPASSALFKESLNKSCVTSSNIEKQ